MAKNTPCNTQASTSLRLTYVADATSIHVQRWLQWMVARGHRVVCLSDKPADASVGFSVVPLPNRESLLAAGQPASKSKVVWARALAIQQWIEAHPCDVLHAHFVYMRGWSGALARALNPASSPPLVITLLGSDIYLPARHYRSTWHFWRDKALNRLALRQAQCITGASMDLCNHAKRMTGSGPLQRLSTPVDWTPIGTDLRLFHPGYRGGAAVHALRASLNIPESATIILSPRQVTPTYNIEVIIEAFASWTQASSGQATHQNLHHSSSPSAVLVLKDTTPDNPERKAYVAKLKRLIEQLGLGQAVRWVDHVPFEQMPMFYAMADVIVSIPKTDGFPVTLFEAMACQTPIITTDLPSYAPVVVANQSALVVPNRQGRVLAEDVAQALQKLFDNPSLIQRLKQRGVEMVTRHGQFEHVMTHVEARYQGLVAQHAELITLPKPPFHLTQWFNGQVLQAMLHWT